MAIKQGYSDSPMTEDHLGMETRCRGIAAFIRTCSTPMTVAIQGDWGTGKSTAMNLIEKCIREQEKDDACIIQFNTWQFAALSGNDKLIVDLLSVMMQAFGDWFAQHRLTNNEDVKKRFAGSRRILRGMQTFMEWGARTVKEVVDDSIVGKGAEAFRETFCSSSGESAPPAGQLLPVSKTEIVCGLKKNLEELIAQILSQDTACSRIYVFVDDLDRLQPRIAVELMEGLKNFADFRDCVFVLAVDQEVVERGLRTKYGEDLQPEKARNFFDKIIQVPFVLPVRSYRIRDYVRQFIHASADPKAYEALLLAFQERNPRTIKRSFNVLQLSECIRAAGSGGSEPDETERLRLYAVHLLQLKSPEAFRELLLTVEQHRAEIEEKDYAGFLASLRALFSTDREEMRIPLTQYLPQAVGVFFRMDADNAAETEAEGIRKLYECIMETRESSDIDFESLRIFRQLRSLRRLRDRLRLEENLTLSEDWDRIDSDADTIFAEGKKLALVVYSRRQRYLMVTWHNAAQSMNLTVYIFRNPDTVFDGIAEKFYSNDELPAEGAEYRYYRSANPSRLTVAGFTDYEEGCTLEKLLLNCGVLQPQEDDET